MTCPVCRLPVVRDPVTTIEGAIAHARCVKHKVHKQLLKKTAPAVTVGRVVGKAYVKTHP